MKIGSGLLVGSGLSLLAFSATAMGQGVIMDGSLDEDFAGPSALQGSNTSFGNAQLGNQGFCDGSEIDGIHIERRIGFVVLFIAGNLESNFNKLEVFLDFRPGGQNQLVFGNVNVDFDALGIMGPSNANATDGLKFDEGFTADSYLTFTCSDDGQGGFVTFSSYATLPDNGNGSGLFLGEGGSGTNILNGENGIQIAIDNSNVGGVDGTFGSGCGQGVNTGIEIAIPTFVLDDNFEDLPLDQVKVCAFISNPGHSLVSNQVIASIPPTENLGDPRNIDFSQIPGLQYAVQGELVDDCPTYSVGACCLGDTICTTLDQANCESGGGVFLGENVSCSDENGENVCAPPTCPEDINSDGAVDVNDLLALLAAYGNPCN